jgi:hypothetical protein
MERQTVQGQKDNLARKCTCFFDSVPSRRETGCVCSGEQGDSVVMGEETSAYFSNHA